jgi:hypothetical protein
MPQRRNVTGQRHDPGPFVGGDLPRLFLQKAIVILL